MSGRFLIGAMVFGLIAICYTIDYFMHHNKHASGAQIISRNASLLMVYIGVSVTLGLFMAGRSSYIATRVVSIAISVFVFEIILLAASDLLRKVCSPSVMVGLWGIVNVLYFLLLSSGYSSNLEPLRIIPVPRTVFLPALALWATGFAVLMGRAVLEHLSFVRQVREGSRVADAEHDAELMAVYKKVLSDYEMYEVPVRLSPAVSVPVAVGLMRIEIVLPMSREYGIKELEYIFRHELTHIAGKDSELKLFMVFCRSLFWFVPLFGRASRKAAEDMELSCDELVLKGADEEERRFYANLILDSEGECRGFTTCLSTGGEQMRYRLKSIMNPRPAHAKEKVAGIIITAISAAALILSFNLVAFTYDYGKLSELAFGGSVKGMISEAPSFDEDSDYSIEEVEAIIDCTEVAYVGEVDTSYDDPRYGYFNYEDTTYIMSVYEDRIELYTLDDFNIVTYMKI